MKKNTHSNKIRNIVLMSIVFLAVFGWVLIAKGHVSKKPLLDDPKVEIRQLSYLTQTQGILAARRYFLDNFFSYSDTIRHYMGHFIGEHVYTTYGLSGITYCYSQIEFGCIHGYLLTGYLDKGMPFLEAVIAQCSRDLPEGCMHGLGHAFLLIRGYEPSNLQDSLDACGRLSVDDGIKVQCYQGVYMEFNDRFVKKDDFSVNWFQPRVFHPETPLEPCDTQPIALQPICHRELVLYWTNISSITSQTMLNYCDMIGLDEARNECYWSVGGYIAGLVDNDLKKSIAWCTTTAIHNTAACLHGAINSVAFEKQTSVSSLCHFLPTGYQSICSRW